MMSQGGDGVMFQDALQRPSAGWTMADLLGLPTNFLVQGDSSINLIADDSLKFLTPGIPVQPPPPVDNVCKQGSSSTSVSQTLETEMPDRFKKEMLTGKLRKQMTPKSLAEVMVIEHPLLGHGITSEELLAHKEWTGLVDTMLPNDILKRAPLKRGRGKYFWSGQKYEPCTWEEFIERTNEKERESAKKPRRRCQIRDPEEVVDPVIVAQQALSEIYGDHFDAADFGRWN